MDNQTNDDIADFIARVDRLQARYRLDKYATHWLMPRELLIAIKDVLRDENKRTPTQTKLFTAVTRLRCGCRVTTYGDGKVVTL